MKDYIAITKNQPDYDKTMQKHVAMALDIRPLQSAIKMVLLESDSVLMSAGSTDFSKPDAAVKAALMQGRALGMRRAIEKLAEMANGEADE